MSKFFIERPIFAWVIAIVVMLDRVYPFCPFLLTNIRILRRPLSPSA